MREVVVIGLGNVLMRDEGIGVLLVNQLAKDAEEYTGIDFLDLGSGGIKIVHALAGRRKAVIVDCAFMEEKPGVMRRFSPAEVATVKLLPSVSGHAGDLLAMLALSRKLGECPPEIMIFGIQPGEIRQGEGLSPVIKQKLRHYLAAIRAELAGHRRAGDA